MSRLTDAAVKAAKADQTTRDIYDEGEAGLCLRVQPSGRKAWGLRVRFRGKQKRYDLGEYPATSLCDARALATAMKKAAGRGQDPATVLRPPPSAAPMVAEAVSVYMETKSGNRSQGMEKRRFELHVLPAIGDKHVDTVTKADLDSLLHDMAHKTGLLVEPNRVFTSLTGFWSWIVYQRGYRADNPMAGMKRPIKIEPSQARQRAGTVAVLSLDELARLWRLAPTLPSSVLPDLVRCMLAVPLRREEWTALRWAEVREIVEDGWAGWALKLPAERMKGRRPAVVPLPHRVVAIINERRKLTGESGFVFSVPGCRTPFAGWKRGADVLRTKLASDIAWTPHDIRRSVATALARDIGTDTEIIKRILQHSDDALLGITAVYQKSHRLKEQAEALEAWGALLEQAAASHGANVVTLEARGPSHAP
jgi:integrase